MALCTSGIGDSSLSIVDSRIEALAGVTGERRVALRSLGACRDAWNGRRRPSGFHFTPC
jgi:hypothetical protein